MPVGEGTLSLLLFLYFKTSTMANIDIIVASEAPMMAPVKIPVVSSVAVLVVPCVTDLLYCIITWTYHWLLTLLVMILLLH